MERTKAILFVGIISIAGLIGIGLLLPSLISTLENKGTPHGAIIIDGDSDISRYNFTGSGTTSDPYLISGLYIEPTSSCITIRNTASYFIIEDCYLVPNAGHGIELSGRGKGGDDIQFVVRNCIIVNPNQNAIGIEMSDHGCAIINNSITGGSLWGIIALDVMVDEVIGRFIITGNTVSGRGISISGGENVLCKDNTVLDCDGDGIRIERVSNSPAVTGNRIERCAGDGMKINADGLVIKNNYISNCENGIYVYVQDNVIVENNTVIDNTLCGIKVGGYSSISFVINCKVIDNRIDSNGDAGIYLLFTQGAILTDNEITNNQGWGIQLESSSGYSISGNYFENNLLGDITS